ncbi:MAG: hypothetical protein IPL60_03345 [Ardenticatenia bacterium]|nr:hypothetical protein [Ardenticatenia bacterium]
MGLQPDAGAFSLGKLLWMGLMRTLDSGHNGRRRGVLALPPRHARDDLGGIFIISSLIGTITSGIESKLDELRKGRSRVVEADTRSSWAGRSRSSPS